MRTSSRLVLAVGLASLATLGVMSSLFIGIQHRELLALDAEHARNLADTILSSTRYAMLHNRRDDIEQIIAAVGAQKEISDVRVFNKEGRIVYSADTSTLGTVVEKGTAACAACHAGQSPAERLAEEDGMRSYETASGSPVLGVIRPIYNERTCATADCHVHPADQAVLGVLDVGLRLDDIELLFTTSSWKAASFAFTATLAVATIVWLVFYVLVGLPVGRLLQATKNVAAGDLGYRLAVKRDDELGQLGASFNEMTAQLAEKQSQLYRSNRMASLGRLAAGVAHEINNPLTGVLTHSSLLLRDAEEGSAVAQDLETIVRETKRCRDIVRGLLDFARQVPPHKTELDINESIDWALDIVDHQLAVGNISVTKSLSQQLPKVRADANQMVQVLLNLLVNAADAMPAGGELFIGTDVEDRDDRRWVVVKVADTGCGIPPAIQDKIFEPFFSTKEAKGTGLGLPVVWGILEEHGATIEVHSLPQRGATFTIRLPLAADTPEEGKTDAS
jgi:two-component system NtrC family sensor kinase